MRYPMAETDKEARHLRSMHGGQVGGPTRARRLAPERRSEIARAGAAARVRRYGRPDLNSLSPEALMHLLRTDPSRSFTRPELRKIVRAFGYHLDRPSHRYWHPAKLGWITIPLGKFGIIPGSTARELLKPLVEDE
jgi:hypothetical protein